MFDSDLPDFGLSLFPATGGGCQVALLNPRLCSIRLENHEEYVTTYDDISQEDVTLAVDYHFLGITPLNQPEGEVVAEYVRLYLPEMCLIEVVELITVRTEQYYCSYWASRPCLRLVAKS